MSTGAETQPVDHGYILKRNKTESQRLEKQNYMFVDMLGFTIHPLIEQKLGPDSWIADVGTGTGIWLRDIAQKYPASVQLHGFDVSTAQYPKTESLPSNIFLHQHDMKETFPIEWQAKFDLVHARFVAGGMKDGDWKVVTNNLLAMLKPGGAIQWTEPDYLEPMETKLDDGTSAVGHQKLWQVFLDYSALGKQAEIGAFVLPQVFSEAGMTGVISPIDKPRSRERELDWSENLIEVAFQVLEKTAKAGVSGVKSIEELRKLRDDALEEVGRGARYKMPVHTTVGFKGE